MTEAKRSKIRRKVAAAESRNEARSETSLTDRAGEKAIEAKDKFAAFAKEHPIATLAGGLALGILVSGLFRGSPTRKAGRKLGSKAADLDRTPPALDGPLSLPMRLEARLIRAGATLPAGVSVGIVCRNLS